MDKEFITKVHTKKEADELLNELQRTGTPCVYQYIPELKCYTVYKLKQSRSEKD
jgi:hypothetical protein